jgi:hypothetical protein
MDKTKLLCVDCYEMLERMALADTKVFYCNNIKCRRFGVLTVGGLYGEKCDRSLITEDEKNIGKEK